MILNRTPLSLPEVKVHLRDQEEQKPIAIYLKNFTTLSLDKALKLKDEIRALNNPKIKEEHVVKMVDFIPRTSEDVNKICSEVNLSEEESSKVLDIVKNY